MSEQLLKLVACVCMVCDHTAFRMCIFGDNPVGIFLHCLGRVAMPVFAFCLVQGYLHTHSFRMYLIRLVLLAAVSEVPFRNFFVFSNAHCVIWEYVLGLILLWLLERATCGFKAGVEVIAFCGAAYLLHLDWSFICPALMVAFYVFRDSKLKMSLAVCASSVVAVLVYGQLWQLAGLLSIPLMIFYNGKRGRGGKIGKWGFYIFYPAQFFVLGAVQ